MALVGPIRIRVQTKPRIRCRVLPRLIPLDATVAVGTVTTLSPGSPATVTNVGTAGAAVFNFGLPAGNTGATGVVQSVVAGTNVTVDNTDPANPKVNATGTPVETAVHAATSKATPVDADELALVDSAASFGLKKLTWANLKAGVLAYFNGTAKATPINTDRVWQGDSTNSNAPVYSTWTQIKSFLFASPSLTGTPTAPTAAVDTNTTQLATTAMVLAQAAAATPLGSMPTAAVGTSTRFARADHVHPGREVLTAARTYYVLTTGSDSNTGLVNNAGGAFLTVQKAVDTVLALDCSSFNVTIQLGAGTRTAGVSMSGAITGTGTLTIVGDTVTPSNVVWNVTGGNCLVAQNTATVVVSGITFQTTTSGSCLYATGVGSVITIGAGCVFGASSLSHTFSGFGGVVQAVANYTISGGATYHALSDFVGQHLARGFTITLTGTPAFAGAFCRATVGSVIAFDFSTFSGSATGVRYQAVNGGNIITGGAALTFIPGNAAGSATGTGSAYL